MGPADLAPNTVPPETHTAEQAKRVERDMFYNSLAPAAKEQFLEALRESAERGLTEDEAWDEAVAAAETTYRGDKV